MWEYKVLVIELDGSTTEKAYYLPARIQNRLNELGADGWELVTSEQIAIGGAGKMSSVAYHFKRLKQGGDKK